MVRATGERSPMLFVVLGTGRLADGVAAPSDRVVQYGIPAGTGKGEVEQDRFGIVIVVVLEQAPPSLHPSMRRDPEFLSP